MYLDYFKLKEEPFSITPDPKFLLMSNQHESAVESLLYGINQRKGFLLLTGEIGTGKTTVCREILNRLDPNIDISVIFNPMMSIPGLLKAINNDFGNVTDGNSAEEQLAALNNYLLSRVENGRNSMVLIDEAQNLSAEALEMTRLLSNLETDKQKLLQIILVGQPELEATLKSPGLRQLNQRISIRQRLGAFNTKQLKEYIEHRLFIAGSYGRILFENSAIKKIHDYSSGYPRAANILCDRSLLTAYWRHTTKIDKTIVKTAIADLNGNTFRPWWRCWPCRSY